MDYRAAREALRERRFRLRWSIAKLAKAADVDRSTIYRIEKTQALPDHQPEWATMVALARAMGTTLEALSSPPTLAAEPMTHAQVEASEVAREWPTFDEALRAQMLRTLRLARDQARELERQRTAQSASTPTESRHPAAPSATAGSPRGRSRR